MAYDEDLADRIRELIGPQRSVQEKKMFGGLEFLVGGNMAIAASGQGGQPGGDVMDSLNSAADTPTPFAHRALRRP